MQRRFLPVPLGAVEAKDGYAAAAFQREIEYLLSLEEGRLLAGFYENAGIRTAYVRYGGWESGLIGGHTLGHYLSALAQASVSGGVSEGVRERLRGKLRTVVDALAECQSRSRGEKGFLWGAPPAKKGGVEAQFDFVEQGKTNIRTQAWVPWYTMHKILAGLVDVCRLTGDPVALSVASALGDWVYARVSRYDARTLRRVLSVEYGGMNDALYSLYSLTKKPEHARAAHLFDEERLFDAVLAAGKDALKDLHANTTVPKILGALNRYLTLHGEEFDGARVDAERYLHVAENFFRMVTERHTYVTGGSSEWEHFGADYVLDAERTNCNCETCIVYNMLKLAEGLFSVTGGAVYADYYDNAFTNQILSSQDPQTGMTTYFQPMASGFFKVFSTPYDSFWCCTGSGMENFTKLGEGIYYRRERNLFVERYLSSALEEDDLFVELSADLPFRTEVSFTVRRAAEPFLVCFRIPEWAAGAMTARKNGQRVNLLEGNGHAALAAREGDEIVLEIPVEVTLKGLPDGKDAFAFRYGGAVLSADFGTEDMEVTTTGVDVLIPAKRTKKSDCVYFPDLFEVFEHPSNFLVREGETFRLVGGDADLTFGLHYRRFRERYALYLRLREGVRRPEEETRAPLDAVEPGYGQYEADELHEMEERNSVGVTAGGSCRYARAGGRFSYDFAVDPLRDNVLSVALRRKDNGKPLTVTAGGETLFSQRLLYTLGEETYRIELPIPRDLIARHGRKKRVNGRETTVLRIEFSGERGAQSARVCESLRIYAE